MDEKKVMTLEAFTNELARQIEGIYSDKYGLSISTETRPVMKTNVVKQGIIVHFEDSNVSPTVYADQAYQMYLNGDVSISEVATRMSELINEAYQQSPEVPQLTPEEAKTHITLTLINTEHNKEILANTPHLEVLGGELAAIPRWNVSDNASFIVTNDVCEKIGLTPDEVLKIGQEHIDQQHFEVKTMQEVMENLLAEMIETMGEDVVDVLYPASPVEYPQAVIVTSQNRLYGSNAMLSENTLNQVCEILGSEYIVFPSSIHEIICVPNAGGLMPPEELRAMVEEINMGQVAPEERLSNQVFKYDGHKLTILEDKEAMTLKEFAHELLYDLPTSPGVDLEAIERGDNAIEITEMSFSSGHIKGEATCYGAPFAFDKNTVLNKTDIKRINGDTSFIEKDRLEAVTKELDRAIEKRQAERSQKRTENKKAPTK